MCLEDPIEIQARLSNAGIESAVRRGDVLKGEISSCVYGTLDGIRFVDLDGLIRLKLRAGGPQDLIDVVQLVRRHREAEPTALRVAEAYRLRDRLESWLADPRIRSPERKAPATPAAQAPRPGKTRRTRGKIRARV